MHWKQQPRWATPELPESVALLAPEAARDTALLSLARGTCQKALMHAPTCVRRRHCTVKAPVSAQPCTRAPLPLQGRPATLVCVELPGLDQQRLKGQPPALPRLVTASRQQVLLQASSALEAASQTTVALLGVPEGKGGGGRGKKRKQPEAPPAATGAAGDQQSGRVVAGHSAAERAFPPSFYCTTARQMRLLAFPPGSAEDAEAAEAADAVHGVVATAGAAAPGAGLGLGPMESAGAGASEAEDPERGGAAAGAASGDRGSSASASAGTDPPGPAVAATATAGAMLPPGWVSTSQRLDSEGAPAEAMVAIDCEMVITTRVRRRDSIAIKLDSKACGQPGPCPSVHVQAHARG